jgi:hypothetical protein
MHCINIYLKNYLNRFHAVYKYNNVLLFRFNLECRIKLLIRYSPSYNRETFQALQACD